MNLPPNPYAPPAASIDVLETRNAATDHEERRARVRHEENVRALGLWLATNGVASIVSVFVLVGNAPRFSDPLTLAIEAVIGAAIVAAGVLLRRLDRRAVAVYGLAALASMSAALLRLIVAPSAANAFPRSGPPASIGSLVIRVVVVSVVLRYLVLGNGAKVLSPAHRALIGRTPGIASGTAGWGVALSILVVLANLIGIFVLRR
jgi:hypothetical protein